MIIELTRSMTTVVDEVDAGLSSVKWFAISCSGKFYAARNLPMLNAKRQGTLLMHRYLTNPPNHMVVDHINGDTLDNRRSNLRVCTHKQNISSSRSVTGNSKFKGVTFDKSRGKWSAQIKVDYKRIYLGRFAVEQDAALAYNKAAISAFGEFAVLNEITA